MSVVAVYAARSTLLAWNPRIYTVNVSLLLKKSHVTLLFLNFNPIQSYNLHTNIIHNIHD